MKDCNVPLANGHVYSPICHSSLYGAQFYTYGVRRRCNIHLLLQLGGHPTVNNSSQHNEGATACEVSMTYPESDAAKLTFISPIQLGAGALVLLLAIYFGVVGLISGMKFALDQFAEFWYFIVPLALGFGIQVGLYTYLKNLVGQHGASGKVVAVSGTTSTAAMVSCCSHYLVNILPILGVTGFLAVVAEYQVELFWLGLVFNSAGILYVAAMVIKANKEHKKCAINS